MVLAVLLAFAIGPGLSLHALGDIYHASHADHEHNHDFTGFGLAGYDSHTDHDGHHDAEHTCVLDHEHDNSHASSGSSVYVSAVPAAVDMAFHVTSVAYAPERREAPPSNHFSNIDRPPRLVATA